MDNSPAENSTPFDTTQVFIVEIQSGARRSATLKYPTDAQWVARTNAQKIIRTDLGRGKSSSKSTPLESWDQTLFTERLQGEPTLPFDEYEASMAIDRLARAEVIESELVGDDSTRVKISVFGDREAEFIMRNPRRRQIVEYGRAAVTFMSTAKGGETRLSLEPSGRLFDELLVKSTGYAEGSVIPIIHKDVVVVEVIRLQNPE